ncbi:hypothetical protein RA263_02470 [Pseudomonas syringae pv. tagetis]|uniref:Uncharacterized protein n=2 Tax=Pseudomonas syringae group genomosp. 7 TaxID=251699 RepID=A0A0Q0B1Z3_9PSED|nr:hypothetical protein [Pseudomonas syringae group genomosp. 7]KPX48648.1 Unknown protein sequence [Pseudomonas syringae pv. helianthi]KPY82327.1 Unknown protein sequence [Pseudomonas syringae pv. tagetis]RMR02716.1 hypothetical protein ALP93_04314 [Pseudomonas syringae pv. helianthi]RMW16297.1 hypothetical protein ALO98_03055 [Pseudomonas syringae pv. tagetis]RMW27610.1 hypothetical protein ALO97_00333 [Pseudomonas syringae pv. tagetis]
MFCDRRLLVWVRIALKRYRLPSASKDLPIFTERCISPMTDAQSRYPTMTIRNAKKNPEILIFMGLPDF